MLSRRFRTREAWCCVIFAVIFSGHVEASHNRDTIMAIAVQPCEGSWIELGDFAGHTVDRHHGVPFRKIECGHVERQHGCHLTQFTLEGVAKFVPRGGAEVAEHRARRVRSARERHVRSF